MLDDIVDRYVEFAGDEKDDGRAGGTQILEHRPLTDTVVQSLNPGPTAAELRDGLTAIGFPTPAA